MMTKRGVVYLLILVGFLAALLQAGCAVTAKNIHDWGYKGDYDRIRQELRQNPGEDVRTASAIELGKGNYAFGIPDLVRLSTDPSPKVRLAAVESLGQYAGKEVYAALIQRSADDNAGVARVAEKILRTWGQETVDFLLEALLDRNYQVRQAAVKVLGRMSDSRVGPALMDCAQRDDNAAVRREAVVALGNLGYDAARKLLFTLKNSDPSTEVTLEAERALAKFGGAVNQIKLLVLPIKAAKELAAPAAKLQEALTGALVKAKLAQLLPGQEGSAPEKSELNAWAVAEAKKAGADQVLFGKLELEANRLSATLYRVDTANGQLLQQERVLGYQGQDEKLCREAGEALVTRFQ